MARRISPFSGYRCLRSRWIDGCFLSVMAGIGGALAGPGAPRPAVGRRLNLVNAHTGESFSGPYRDDKGPIAGALDELSYFCRDFPCNEKAVMDLGFSISSPA